MLQVFTANENGRTGTSMQSPGYTNALKCLLATAGLLFSIFAFGQMPNVSLLTDINPGAGSSSPSNLVKLGTTVIFSANNGSSGTELWKTDATNAGTQLIKDINPGAPSSSPGNFRVMGSFVYFTANDGVNGGALWRTDGTLAGTTLVKDINPTSTSSASGISELVVIGTKLYFRADNGTNGNEPWISDGTPGGTTMLKDIRVGSGSSGVSPACLDCFGTFEFVQFNGFVYFNANDGSNGGQNSELWRTDGTTAGTLLFKDFYAFGGGGPGNFVNAGSFLFFTVDDAISNTGVEPWKTDGTLAGTVLIKDVFNPGFNQGSILGDVPTIFMNGYVYFVAVDVYEPNPPPGVLFYINAELWRTDGTAANTTKVKEINTNTTPGQSDANPNNFFVNNNILYFQANNFTNGVELWSTDGTTANTNMIKDINSGSVNSNPNGFTLFNGFIYFAANNSAGGTGTELWRTDGTSANTLLVNDINPGTPNGSPGDLTPYDATKMLLRANNGVDGSELFIVGGASCPSFPGAPANVSITNSSCGAGCTVSGGSITAPSGTPCPSGSTLQYQVNGGAWSATLPVYAQTGPAQSIKTRCSCDADNTMNSAESGTVTTVPGACAVMTLSTTQVNVLCNGAATGSIDLTVNGGVSPYSYFWTGGVTTQDRSGLVAGTYTVTVTDANSCTKTTSATITQSSALVLSTTQVNVLCNGNSTGSIDLTVSGGAPGYTYLWTGGATTQDLSGLAAGTYTVTVTDMNTCTKTTSATITAPSAIVLSTTQVNVLCNGASTGSIDLTVSGGASPYTYAWTGGATMQDRSGLAAGTYTVTVTDFNGCTKTSSATITQPTAIVLSTTQTNIFCAGPFTGSIDLTVSGGASPYTYAWTGGATTQDVSGLAAGTYTVMVTDFNGCTKTTSATITSETCTTVSGTITWENNPGTGVKDAVVALTGAASGTMNTDINGLYSITVVGSGNFTVTPTKSINLLNGVTISDAQAVQQHLAGNFPITSAYKIVAADVNKSNSVSTVDASLITQAILGNPAALNIFNTSWRFTPSTPALSNPPWGFAENIVLTGVSGLQANKDFIGMKIGDVNGSANPALNPQPNLVWTTEDKLLAAGEEISVPFAVYHFNNLGAYQFALQFDPASLQFEQIATNPALPVAAGNFGTFNIANGEIRTAWSQAGSLSIPEGTTVFILTFKALQGGVKLSTVLAEASQIMPAEASTANFEAVGLNVVFTETTGVNSPGSVSGLQLMQNRPNPFVHQTAIGFVLPQACTAQLKIHDASGRLLAERNGFYTAGYHEELFDLSATPGMLYYELITPAAVLARKMILTGGQ